MRRAAIVGVGHSKFGNRGDVNLSELAFESIREALLDAHLTQKDIESVFVGTQGWGWYEERIPEAAVADYAGLNPAGLCYVSAACASGSAAVRATYSAVASGIADIAMAVGVEKMTEVDTPTVVDLIGRAGCYTWEFENFGLTFPGFYALHANAHMAKYRTTQEQLAMAAVKNHKYGAMNPKAQFQREITIEDVMKSRMVAYPLKIYDCCPITDGSATIIVASEEKARKITDSPIWIKGIGAASDAANLSKRRNYVGVMSAALAAQQAYKMANIGPEDLDMALVHDCFTIAEIMAYEDLGFCKKGEGGRLIQDGQTYIGGKIPVNVDGGLKAKGHPIGATGVAQCAEITKQLRGEAGNRQVPLKKGLGLAHNVGGSGQIGNVTILGRDTS